MHTVHYISLVKKNFTDFLNKINVCRSPNSGEKNEQDFRITKEKWENYNPLSLKSLKTINTKKYN